MSESTNAKSPKDDEIDLLDLFKRMGKSLGKMFSAIGRGILISIVFLFRNWLPLLLSLILGLGVSYLLKITSPSYYTSDMVLRNNAVVVSDLMSYIDRLNTYCVEGNTKALTEALSISSESIKNILDIKSHWIIDKNKDGIPDIVDYKDKHSVYDTIDVMMMDRLDIRVKTKSPQELTTIKNGIIKYINSDSLFQQRNRLRIRQNSELLTRLEYDIVQLDSLQKVKYFEETRNRQPQSGGQMIFLQEQKTQLLYTDIYTLYSRKQSIESERDLFRDIVTILSDFSIPAIRENSTFYYCKKMIPLFVLVTLLILLIMANRKKLKEIFEKY
jgi:hypothetical protein